MRDLAARAVRAGMAAVSRTREADREAEAAILAVLRAGDPDAAFFGEESGGDLDARRLWVVDGVDGTENLVRGSDFVAVTCALLVDGAPAVAATGCPFTGEIFSAARGEGSFDADGRRMRVSEEGPVAVDPESSDEEYRDRWDAACAAAAGDVVLRGSIALELAYCAAGRFRGVAIVGRSYVQDYAAGTLLVEEAGGRISEWPAPVVVAGAPETFRELRERLLP